jgi:hypothetical protein
MLLWGVLLWALAALCASNAAAQPGSGPREDINQGFTTAHPGSPTGSRWSATYHAAGKKSGNPPYLRRMVFHPPRGMRLDTSVPARCTATDVQLEAFGPDACPPGSRLGAGTVKGIFYEPIGHDFIVDRYTHHVDVMNNANEQIVLVHAEGYAVVRGRVQPDGTQDFRPPTCFPAPPVGNCLDDYIRQLYSATFMPAYVRKSGGRVRSYMRTPPKCPASGYWRSTVKFWWGNGSVDSVVTKQPCRAG